MGIFNHCLQVFLLKKHRLSVIYSNLSATHSLLGIKGLRVHSNFVCEPVLNFSVEFNVRKFSISRDFAYLNDMRALNVNYNQDNEFRVFCRTAFTKCGNSCVKHLKSKYGSNDPRRLKRYCFLFKFLLLVQYLHGI